jgi:hypothetical protein
VISRSKTALAAVGAVVALAVAAPVAQSKPAVSDDTRVELRQGADDAAQKANGPQARGREAEARNGADDRAGDDSRARVLARHRADDRAGDDHRRGRRGGDDGPNHG